MELIFHNNLNVTTKSIDKHCFVMMNVDLQKKLDSRYFNNF